MAPPDPKAAKGILEKVVMDLDEFPKEREVLEEICEILPDRNNVRTYGGKKVNSNTFRRQRDEISEVMRAVELSKEAYLSEVDGQLLSDSENMELGSRIFSTVSMVCGLFALYCFMRRKE